jgi:hypothetical protein
LGTFWLKIEQFWPFEGISIFSNGGHLGYRTALTDTIFKGTIPARFGLIWFSGFREDLNVIFYPDPEPADPLAKAQRQKPVRKAPTKREPPPPKRRKISKTDAAEALLELSSSFTSLSSDITTHEDLNNAVPVSENNSVDKDDSQSQDEQKCQPSNDICDTDTRFCCKKLIQIYLRINNSFAPSVENIL